MMENQLLLDKKPPAPPAKVPFYFPLAALGVFAIAFFAGRSVAR